LDVNRAGGGLSGLAAATARRLPLRARLLLYRLGPVTRWLRRALNRVVPEGIHPVQIASGDLAGSWLLLDLHVDKDLWLGNYEPDVAEAIRRFVPAGGTAYDLGANIGYTTLLLARRVGESGKVFAFEPLASNLERLRQAVGLNDLGGRITIVPAAVGAKSGPSEFRVHASGGMGRLGEGAGRDHGFVATASVDVVTLDDFVYGQGNPPPQTVKVDLEGGEGLALEGMGRLLREARPSLLIELHGPEARAAAARALAEHGYGMHRMRPGYREVDLGEAERLPKHIVALAKERSL